MIRILAPHFTAGVVFATGAVGIEMVVRVPPIVKYMKGWSRAEVLDYCARKRWKVD